VKEIGGGELEMAAVLRCREEGARGAGAGKEARQGSVTPFIERGRERKRREREVAELERPAMKAKMVAAVTGRGGGEARGLRRH